LGAQRRASRKASSRAAVSADIAGGGSLGWNAVLSAAE